ncbi:MAG: hypothetical protein ACOC56_02660 [Atribacterota bacterium]
MNITKKQKIKELEYHNIDCSNLTNREVDEEFKNHVENNLQEIKINTIYNNIDIKNEIIINTPDGLQQLGNLVIKHNKDIYNLITSNGHSIKCSHDHLIETPSGWIKTENIKCNDYVLTKDGFSFVTSNNMIRENDTVYDFEVLHDNHRYWGGTGISSHNTGKTFVILNIIRNAIEDGYHVVFYDSENAVDQKIMTSFGIDLAKVRYEPTASLQQFRSHITKMTDILIEKKRKGVKIPKIAVFLDSAGNLPTQKEITDAIEGNDKADMTRAKLLKSIFRILMFPLAELKIPFVFSNHTYDSQSFISMRQSSGGCLLPGNKVIMADNTLKNIEDIEIGDFVTTLDGSYEILQLHEFEKESYEIEFEDGTSITCSEDHRFFLGGDYLNDNNWIKAKDIKEDDEVLKFQSFIELKKLKIKNAKKLGVTKVHDLTVDKVQHYISENGIINHNSGPQYAASIILFLDKKQLKEGSGKNKLKTGIIIKAAPNKNRFAKPQVVETFLRYDEGMNPYVGLEQYFNWDIVGLAPGIIKDGIKTPQKTAKTWIAKHLDYEIKTAAELYTPKVFTKEILEGIDKYAEPIFNYGINDEISDDIISNISSEVDIFDDDIEIEE